MALGGYSRSFSFDTFSLSLFFFCGLRGTEILVFFFFIQVPLVQLGSLRFPVRSYQTLPTRFRIPPLRAELLGTFLQKKKEGEREREIRFFQFL